MSKIANPTEQISPIVFQAIFPGTSQKVAVAGSSAQSSALPAKTSVVRLYSDTDCFVAIGANPTALADGTSMFLPAGAAEYFGCNPSDKVAVIQSSASGNLYITAGA